MRLIDADKVMDALDDAGIELYHSEYEEFQKNLDNIPTIDPESLRPTAHWINEDSFYKDSTVWSCSACKGKIVLHGGTPENENYQYCPHCGKRMVNADD